MTAKKRRDYGDGSVFWDASRGCWVGSVDIGRNPQTGRRIRRKVSAATRPECKEKLDELRAELKRTGTVARRDITVRAAVEGLLEDPPETWRSPNTFDVYRDHADRIIAAFGSAQLVRLSVAQVEALLRAMARDGKSRSTISRTRGLLAQAIRRCERHGVISRNVASLAELPAAPTRTSRAMTEDQVRSLLALELTPWWRAYIILGVTLGPRPGEMLGLTWDDIDMDAGVLSIRRALHQAPGGGRAGLAPGSLKTSQSRRSLRIPAAARAALTALKRDQAANRLRLGVHYQSSGMVFCDSAGRPPYPQDVRGAFRKLCGQAGIGEWTLRELRHTFVSQLSHAGIDIEVIADHAGHINSTVTRSVYRHQLADVVGTAASVFDAIYKASS